MKKKNLAVILVLICTLLVSVAQISMKLGADKATLDFVGLITDIPLILGMILYLAGAILFFMALKHGELSVLYPFIATSYIWVTLISYFFLEEPLGSMKLFSVSVITLGVSFIGVGGKR